MAIYTEAKNEASLVVTTEGGGSCSEESLGPVKVVVQ